MTIKTMLHHCMCRDMVFVTVEGLGLKFTSVSYLAKVADYQNASIYLDLSSNSAFINFKVTLNQSKALRARTLRIFRFPSFHTTRARMTSQPNCLAGTSEHSR